MLAKLHHDPPLGGGGGGLAVTSHVTWEASRLVERFPDLIVRYSNFRLHSLILTKDVLMP